MLDINVVNFITVGVMSLVFTAVFMLAAKYFGVDVSMFGL